MQKVFLFLFFLCCLFFFFFCWQGSKFIAWHRGIPQRQKAKNSSSLLIIMWLWKWQAVSRRGTESTSVPSGVIRRLFDVPQSYEKSDRGREYERWKQTNLRTTAVKICPLLYFLNFFRFSFLLFCLWQS